MHASWMTFILFEGPIKDEQKKAKKRDKSASISTTLAVSDAQRDAIANSTAVYVNHVFPLCF